MSPYKHPVAQKQAGDFSQPTDVAPGTTVARNFNRASTVAIDPVAAAQVVGRPDPENDRGPR
jgi:hypothetical protein